MADRRAAFDNAGLAEPVNSLIEKVASYPTRVIDDDVAAVAEPGGSGPVIVTSAA